MRRMIVLAVTLVALSSPGYAGDYAESAFRAEGYSEKTKTPDQTISIRASVAEGLIQLQSKTLYGVHIEIKNKKRQIEFTGDEGLFKPGEVLVKGHATITVREASGKKTLLKAESLAPEDVLYYSDSGDKITSPAANLALKGHVYKGRSLAVDLHDRKVTWVHSVADEHGTKLKTPLELKY